MQRHEKDGLFCLFFTLPKGFSSKNLWVKSWIPTLENWIYFHRQVGLSGWNIQTFYHYRTSDNDFEAQIRQSVMPIPQKLMKEEILRCKERLATRGNENI